MLSSLSRAVEHAPRPKALNWCLTRAKSFTPRLAQPSPERASCRPSAIRQRRFGNSESGQRCSCIDSAHDKSLQAPTANNGHAQRIQESPSPAAREPGWYPDPLGSTAERYWDGSWTALIRKPNANLVAELPGQGSEGQRKRGISGRRLPLRESGERHLRGGAISPPRRKHARPSEPNRSAWPRSRHARRPSLKVRPAERGSLLPRGSRYSSASSSWPGQSRFSFPALRERRRGRQTIRSTSSTQ